MSDWLSMSVRLSRGTVSVEPNVSSCICEPNFFLDPSTSDCASCPAPESDCKQAGTTLATMRTAPGFYRSSNATVEFFECHESDDCPGGLAHEQCRDGHTGVLCAVCAENFVRVNGVCSYCDTRHAAAGFTGVSFGAILTLLMVLLCVFTRKTA